MKNLKFLSSVIICFCVLNPKIIFSQDLVPKEWHNLTGYWKFQNLKDLNKATVGNNLTLVGTHTWVKGPSYDDTAIRIAIGSYYKCKHNIAPNGGGDSVNRYTMMYDFKILSLKKWHTFFQTDTTNSNDGECFIRPNTGSRPGRIGVAATSYTNDSVFPNKWYRLVISVNNGNFYRYYLNGKLILEGDTQDIDDRFALTPNVLFFADENQEDDTIDIASLAIFDTCLSTKDIAKIGTIEPCIAKPPIVKLGNDTTLCLNSSINLNAGNGFAKYQWSNGSGLPFAYYSASTLGLGKKSVWVKVVDKNGCTGGDTIVLNIVPIPKIELGNDTALCHGNKLIIVGGTDTTYKYAWKNSQNGKIISTNNKITIDTTGKYFLYVSSPFGCTAFDSIAVIFYKNPPKPEIKTSGNTSFCRGDSVKLYAQSGFESYLWSNNKTGNEIYISSNAIISLKITDKNKCSSPWSDSLNIKVFENPVSPTVIISPDSVFCSGDSVKLSVSNGFKEYKWNTGSAQSTITVKQSGWFYVMVTDSNNCKSGYSKNVNIFELQAPQKQEINIKGEKEFCEGDSVELSVKSGFAGYMWNDGNTKNINKINKSGTYKAKVKDVNGCYSPWSDEVKIIVNPLPSMPEIINGTGDSLICNNDAETYKWYSNNIDLSLNYKEIKAPISGYYKVKVAIKSCWSPLSDSVFHKKLSIQSINSINKVALYPNPTKDELKVEFERNEKFLDFEVFDFTGKKINYNIEFRIIKQGILIKTDKLPNGIYHINFKTDSRIIRLKFEKN